MRPLSSLSMSMRAGALALAVLALSACDDSTGSSGEIFRVDVNPVSPTLNVGSSQQMLATAVNPSGRILGSRSVTWASSTPAVATISAEGLVTAVAGGTTTISATIGGESAEVPLTVLFPAQSVTLAAAAGQTTTIRQEGSVTIVPTILANGAPVTGRQIEWTSSNPAVAGVNAAGIVSGLTDGTTTITARTVVGGVEGTIPVTVSGAPVVATVTLAVTSNRYIGNGQTEQINATARAASGTVLSLAGRTVVWSSSNAGNASVSGTGLVTMNTAAGTSNIGVTVDGIAQTAAVTVVGSPVLVNNTPVVLNLADGDSISYVIQVPAGTDTLVATITGGTGDPDIIVRPPTGTICTPFLGGSNETCRYNAPVAGRWRIYVEAFATGGAANGVSLNVRLVDNP